MKLLEILIIMVIKVYEVQAAKSHETVIKKFKIRKIYARFKDNVWVADLAEIWVIILFWSNGVIDAFSKY